ncbi:MAG: hypothetical protein MJ224_01295 [archaeon]|nr:hypothetical protein [archaeon]
MHYWGDEWFQKYGNDLYKAIDEIDKQLRKYHIGAITKEKWGCRREDMLRFWDGGLYTILFGYRLYIGTFRYKGLFKFKWFENFINKIHRFIYNKLDKGIPNIPSETKIEDYKKYYNKRIWKGLIYYNQKIGLTKLINNYQVKMYNKIYQQICKKYPHIVDELIMDIDGYEMIKPCKWGNIDGKEIHNKYWKSIY